MHKPQLIRGLNLWDTTSLVVGTIIGTGVFLKTASMAQAVGTPGLVLLAWVAAGLLSLFGALSYAELGAMMPHAGGEYVYLRSAYGDLPAFFYGWMRLTVGSAGSIAVYGVAFATFLSAIFPMKTAWVQVPVSCFGQSFTWEFGMQQVVAVTVILLFSALNCLRVAFGGRVQTILTVAKVLGVGVIIFGVFFFSPGASWDHFKAPADAKSWSGFSAFGVAMLAALWAFDGWNNMPMAAGEVKTPGRNIPGALFFGMIIVLLVYGLVNVAYFYALPFNEIVTSNSSQYRDALPVAGKAAQTFLGERGPQLISIAFIISTVGVLNGSILTSARVPYAMAQDGLFFSRYATLDKNTSVPVASIVLQAVWACVLAISGTFDQLSNCVVFAGWIFYASTTGAVFVLRRKMPDAPRPYKTFGYPIVPALFVILAVWLLINTLITTPLESVVGLGLIALGLPVYFWQKKSNARRAASQPQTVALQK